MHVHQDLELKARRGSLINLSSLWAYVRAVWELMGGYFNMSHDFSRHPPSVACRGDWCMVWCPLAFPSDNPTHFSCSDEMQKATCIEHVLVKGTCTIPHVDVLPSHTLHKPLLATIEPKEDLASIRSWHMIRWRHTPLGTLSRLVALVNLLWG